ncbi:amidase signature enzyme [Penicillium malachiteum]|nr:amidase signature enzyme [Penicillium malachiteum]
MMISLLLVSLALILGYAYGRRGFWLAKEGDHQDLRTRNSRQPPYIPLKLGKETYIQRSTNLPLGIKITDSLVSLFAVKPGDRVDLLFLRKAIATYLQDDVYREEFLAGVIFTGARRSEVTLDLDIRTLRKEWGIKWVCFISGTDLPQELSPGPYSIIQGILHDVRKVYSDNNYGFVQAVWPSHDHKEFLELRLAGERFRSLGIAVPSKIHASLSTAPLAGVRIGVKDIFDLKGLRTSLGSLPYYELYPPCQQTADTVTRLISMGAEVVGKLAMSAFALQEHPMQTVDYQAPVNPRADGYQILGGSSSGGAAAIASYEWFDLALVTDTNVLGARLEQVSLADDWAVKPPELNEALDLYLVNINAHGFYYAAYQSFNEFRSAYTRKYGKPPFITEVVKWIWNIGNGVNKNQHCEAQRRLEVFRTWFLEKYISIQNENVVFILPIAAVNPQYRDVYPGIPDPPSTGLRAITLSPAVEAPELAVPIGEISYLSKISHRIEKLPVLAGLMGMPGGDLELVQLALNSLEALSLPTKVHTGKLMFQREDEIED